MFMLRAALACLREQTLFRPLILAAERLSVDPARCLVFEDAEVGIIAATAAGCQVCVIAETHKRRMEGDHWQLENYERVMPKIADGALGLIQF
ncbi:HAD-superfamily hydrolase, subfamily IA, variant 3 [Agrobacterium sp. ATCC 31749]|nr:HAD-superfamily hydrolase, subfamily IA, variant 3 [Agrobacterium sp. ATCC 31749]QKX00437.1 HAD-IA family hydrolase [Agrobacterium sp. CGMCC 11546]